MSKPLKKSATIYFKSAPPVPDAEANVIRDIVIIQEFQGEDTDAYGDNFGVDFLEQIIEQGNAQTQGVKCRFGHPSMCGPSALGTFVGRYKNFRLGENSDGKKVVLADLHISPLANKSPNTGSGKLGEYIMDMAANESDMCGNSIVFIPGEPRIEVEQDQKGEDYFRFYTQLEEFLASDVVDSPAATEHLFKDITGKDAGLQITKFLDENPIVVDAIQKALSTEGASPIDLLLKYFNSKKDNTMATEKAKQTVAQLKAAKLKEAQDKKKLEKESQKSYDAATSGGLTVTISDEDGDGKPAEGDMITNTETGEPVSGETQFPDGSSVTADESGNITAVTAATSSESTDVDKKEIIRLKGVETAHVKTIKQLEAQVAELKEKFDATDSALDTSLAENIKLKEDLAKTKGTHKPKEGDEDFVKPDEEKEKLSLKDRKAARRKDLEEKNKSKK